VESAAPRTVTVEEDSKEYKKALLFIRSGDLEKAREILEEFCGQNPKSARAFNKLAYVYLEIGNLEAAEKVLDGLLSADRKDFYTHFLYGRLLMRRGEVANAVTHYTTALTINPKDIYTLNGVAEALLVQGDRKKAIRCLKKAIELAPSDTLTYHNLAQLYLDMGQIQEAHTIVLCGLARLTKDARLLYLKGRCLLGAKDSEGARALFEELSRDYPGQAWGRLGLGLLCVESGDINGAVREMLCAVSAEPKNLEANERLASAFSRLGERDKALAVMEKALALAPRDLRIQTLFARTLYDRRLILKAWLRIQGILSQDASYTPARLLKAVLYLDEDLPRKAEEEISLILVTHPQDKEARGLLAECRALQGAPGEAEEMARNGILELGPSRQFDLARALACRAKGDTKGYSALLESLADPDATDRVAYRVKKLAGL